MEKINTLFKLSFKDNQQTKLSSLIDKNQSLLVEGLVGSGINFRMANEFINSSKTFLFILSNSEEAAYSLNDLECLVGDKNALFFPASYRNKYNSEDIDSSNVLVRSHVLKCLLKKKPKIIVTYPEAIFEKIISINTLKSKTLTLKKGMNISLNYVNESLFKSGFERVDFVSSPGEFSLRGGIIDVFSFSNQTLPKLYFFDNLGCFTAL